LAKLVPETFVAKAAVISAEFEQQELTALLLAVLTLRDVELLAKAFPRAVRTPEILRRYVAFLRSGCSGRRNLGTRPKKLIQDWLNACPVGDLRAEAFGSFRPSLADIVRWTHPKPVDTDHALVFGWMVGRPTDVSNLPAVSRPNRRLETRVGTPQRIRIRAISRVEGVEL
jgi:60 kDa SS-A/Ro ribonucleoprotein